MRVGKIAPWLPLIGDVIIMIEHIVERGRKRRARRQARRAGKS